MDKLSLDIKTIERYGSVIKVKPENWKNIKSFIPSLSRK